MAVNFGITIGFSSNDLLIALLVTQFVSFPGTILINSIAGYKTSEFSIMLCLIIYILIPGVHHAFTKVVLPSVHIPLKEAIYISAVRVCSRTYFFLCANLVWGLAKFKCSSSHRPQGQKRIFIRRYWNLIRKYMEVQNGNINPHKHTSEASICKIGFPAKNLRTFFIRPNRHF